MWQTIAILCVVGTIILWALAKFQKDGKENYKMSFAGVLIVLFVVSLYLSNSNDENALAKPQNPVSTEASKSNESEEITIDDFTFKNFSLAHARAWSGAVEVTNNSNTLSYKTLLFSIIFYDQDGNRLGIGKGVSALKPKETKTVSFITIDDLSTVSTYKYQIDVANSE